VRIDTALVVAQVSTSTARVSPIYHNIKVRPGSHFVMIYPHDPTKTPQANSIAPSANEFGLDADVKAKFLFCQVMQKLEVDASCLRRNITSCCWVPLAAWQLSPQFRFILLVMSDESSGSIGAGDAATIGKVRLRVCKTSNWRGYAYPLRKLKRGRPRGTECGGSLTCWMGIRWIEV
jgi:hypothetical protein